MRGCKSKKLDEKRKEIIEFLKTGEKTAVELSEHIGVENMYLNGIMGSIPDEYLLYEDKIDGVKVYGLLSK